MAGTISGNPQDSGAALTTQSSPTATDQPFQSTTSSDLTPSPITDDQIDTVILALNDHIRTAGLQAALSIGEIVVTTMYNGDVSSWRSHGEKDASFRKLARHCKDVESGDGRLQMSASTLYRSVAIYVLCQELGVSTWKHLSVSHLRAVLGLPLDQQRKLLTLAEAKALTTDELEHRVAGLRKPDGTKRGRPALPAFVKSIGALGRLVARADGDPDPFGDLEQVDALSPEEAEALWKTVTGVQQKCEELAAKLALRVSGSELSGAEPER